MKIILGILAAIVLLLIISFSYIKLALPDVGNAENIHIELNAERVARGKYLFHARMACAVCHSTRDWSKYSGPVVPETIGKGGQHFDETKGFPGNFIAKNLTPYHLSNWTDGEIFRAITQGVSKDGRPLFPIMPYENYRLLDREEIYDIIAYIRTLEPIEFETAQSEPAGPMNFIIHLIPQQSDVTNKKPSHLSKEAYGKYLLTSASCNDCHTPMTEDGQFIQELAFSGGNEYLLESGGIVRSANITPDMETGIGKWTEAQFVQRFKQYDDSTFVASEVKNNTFNTEMPWLNYAKMDTIELKAIYSYLRTVKSIRNSVIRFSPNQL